MIHKLIQRLALPDEIRSDYWEQTVRSNSRIITIIMAVTIAVQLFNLYNLFALSKSKLGTLNNRIYFGFYCSMLLVCLLYLLVSRLWGDQLKRLISAQCAGFSAWLIWGTALNYYDLVQAGHSVSTVIFVTALFGTVICIQVVPWYAWINYLTVGTFFIICAYPILGLGESWNLIVGMVIVLIISFSRFSYTVKDIQNRKLIKQIHEELLEKTERLDLSLQKYHYVLNQTNNIILDWDLETDTAVFSGNWSNLFGLPSEIPSFSRWTPPASFLSEPRPEEFALQLKQAAETGNELKMELAVTDVLGKKRWYSFHFRFQADSHGVLKSGLGYLEDISRHKQEILRLESTAKADGLTGLLNRHGLVESFQENLSGHGRLAMILLDIDGFKEINDKYGHPCGDQGLIHLAQVLRKNFRGLDGIGRIGGDEFMVIFPLSGDVSGLISKTEELLKRAPLFTWEARPVSLKFSVGLALWDNDSFESLYKKADAALYMAKHKKKGSYQLYAPGM